jgi:hypothetical protein
MLDDDPLDYNILAEIPGGDLSNEVVMIGAHLDAQPSGTGATDNAAGSAVVMEAVRLLKAADAQPRRTIRAALWGAEESGHLGSLGYVAKHFGNGEAGEGFDVGDEIGSIEIGEKADFIILEGHPFDYRVLPTMVFIDGVMVYRAFWWLRRPEARGQRAFPFVLVEIVTPAFACCQIKRQPNG